MTLKQELIENVISLLGGSRELYAVRVDSFERRFGRSALKDMLGYIQESRRRKAIDKVL